jgi:hypothetical protein
MKKEILFPIFLQCASQVEDPFWRYVYEDLSYGKCPYGLSLQKNYLSCYIRGKEFSYKMDADKPPEILYQELDSLLRERAGILSEKEKLSERARLCRLRTNKNKEEWSQVKKKMIRDTLLEQYVLENSQKYQIASVMAKRVLSMLIVGLMFKTITAKDIFYQNGFIKKIEGFDFEPKKAVVCKDVLHCKNYTPPSHDEGIPAKPLHSYWSTYLEEIKLV